MTVVVDDLAVDSESIAPPDEVWVPSAWDALTCPDETVARLRELPVPAHG